jgi:hypothetical protein
LGYGSADPPDNYADDYVRSIRRITEYVGSQYRHGEDNGHPLISGAAVVITPLVATPLDPQDLIPTVSVPQRATALSTVGAEIYSVSQVLGPPDEKYNPYEKYNNHVDIPTTHRGDVYDSSTRGMTTDIQATDHYHSAGTQRLDIATSSKRNHHGFSKQQIQRADAARTFQATIGFPSTHDLKNIVKANLIPNCPVTSDDIDLAERIYGPDAAVMKKRTMRVLPRRDEVDDPQYTTL